MRPNVTVIGAGSWGTTLASMCARHGPTTIWALEGEVVEQINARRSNSLYLKGFSPWGTTEIALSPPPTLTLCSRNRRFG